MQDVFARSLPATLAHGTRQWNQGLLEPLLNGRATKVTIGPGGVNESCASAAADSEFTPRLEAPRVSTLSNTAIGVDRLAAWGNALMAVRGQLQYLETALETHLTQKQKHAILKRNVVGCTPLFEVMAAAIDVDFKHAMQTAYNIGADKGYEVCYERCIAAMAQLQQENEAKRQRIEPEIQPEMQTPESPLSPSSPPPSPSSPLTAMDDAALDALLDQLLADAPLVAHGSPP